jgi:5-aminolevulinate synthase
VISLNTSKKVCFISKLDYANFGTSASNNSVFDYEGFYNQELEKKKNDRSYRYFNNINRLAKAFPTAHTGTGEHVTVFCANDYLGMSRHPKVINAMKYFTLMKKCVG